MKNVSYIIKADAGVVVAVLKTDPCETIDIFYNTLVSAHNTIPARNRVVNVEASFLTAPLKNQYVGVAKCSKNDKFDVEFGKKLALTRAKLKKTKAIQKRFDKYVDMMHEYYKAFEKKYDSIYREAIDLSCKENEILADAGVEK